MKKLISIEGLHCDHCRDRAEKALNAIDGVEAKVNLKKKQATVSLSKEVADQSFADALEEAGYQMVSIEEKKGLFG